MPGSGRPSCTESVRLPCGVPAGSRVPYLVLGLVLVVLLGAQTLNRQWSTDYWVHQATIETFRHDLTNPPNELTHSRDPSLSYTPYTFVLAAVASVTGWAVDHGAAARRRS